jgi:hypothetical protein
MFFTVLKGQVTLAQGKRRRSVALGCNGKAEIVRAQLIFKDKIEFRTKQNRLYDIKNELVIPSEEKQLHRI